MVLLGFDYTKQIHEEFLTNIFLFIEFDECRFYPLLSV